MSDYSALQTQLDDNSYQHTILQDVSRTFALTIPQLPDPLSHVVGNAYLLCRIADTIEDDKHMQADIKREFAEMFTEVVAGQCDVDKFSKSLFPLLSSEASEAEHNLIANTAPVIRITHSFNQRQRAALQRCVSIMAEGMVRYQDTETLDGVNNLEDMGQYCYYVAGVVGEMLTELFCDYSEEIDQHRDELMKLSVSFGQALQMTNILKDIWEDHHRGACWLPRDVFNKFNVDITSKTPGDRSEGFKNGLSELVGVAHAHLDNALRYSLILPHHEKGLRRFCLWALGMAVLTLCKINKNPWFTEGSQVKISRRSVKATILFSNLGISHDGVLKLMYNIAGRNLPVSPIHEKAEETANHI